MISSGNLSLIRDIDTRRKVLTYYSAAKIEQHRIYSRITKYAPTVYELIPRQQKQEWFVNSSLTHDQKLAIAKRAAQRDMESLLIAERNLGQLMVDIVAEMLLLATDLKDDVSRGINVP